MSPKQLKTPSFHSPAILSDFDLKEGGQLPMCPPVITHVYSYRPETERFPPRAYGRNMWKVHTEIFFVTTSGR